MSEQTNMEEAINQFVKSLEEEQKYDKLIEVSKNAKTASEEANLAKNIENTTDLTSEDSYKKIEKFLTTIISLITESEVSEIKSDRESGQVKVYGKNLGIAIGKNGKNLEAIEYITNLYIKRKDLLKTGISLDIKDYRKKRCKTIKDMALKMAQKAVKEGKKIALKPMPPYERKIVHDALSDNKDVKTKSKDKDPYRKIIIYPLKDIKK